MEYRANFVFASLSSLGGLGSALFGLSLFYQQGHRLGGWSWPEALIVLGVFTILQGVSASLFNVNLNRIVQQVQEGTLDFVLLKPISSQFWLSTRVFSPWGLVDIGCGLLLILYAGIQLRLPAWAYVLGLVPLLLGWSSSTASGYAGGHQHLVCQDLQRHRGVAGLGGGGAIPAGGLSGGLSVVFYFVVPVAFLTTVPAEALLGRIQWPWLVGSALLAAGLLWGSHLFWRFALRFYTSASS
jgi:ABC-type uncharacterized transport system, permease component, COG3694